MIFGSISFMSGFLISLIEFLLNSQRLLTSYDNLLPSSVASSANKISPRLGIGLLGKELALVKESVVLEVIYIRF